MTVVCLWLNNSYGRSRITAISDTRATQKLSDGSLKLLTEHTNKLFRLRVRAHDGNSFDHDTGSWQNPYFETEIGLGFSGYCFEALSIIAYFSRALEELADVSVNQVRARPSERGIAELLGRIVIKYFSSHNNKEERTVSFIIFGYSAINGEPWAFCVKHSNAIGVNIIPLSLDVNDVHIIGSATSSTSVDQRIEQIRKMIRRHKEDLKQQDIQDGRFIFDLEFSRHESADKKSIEEEVLAIAESVDVKDVGGVIQKMEAYNINGKTLIAFSRDRTSDLLDGLPMVGDQLGYLPVLEKMGRR